MDIDLCHRIQCGAVSQSQAGMDALLECSQAGLVGVFGCGHPNCAPYIDEMRAAGVCPPASSGYAAYTARTVGTSSPPSLPLLTVALPSITPVRSTPAPYVAEPEPWYCPINRWAGQNRGYAVLVLAGVYLALGGWKGRTVQP